MLTTHRNPDPDGLGAQLGLDYLLRSSGKDSLILNHDAVFARLRFLDPERRVRSLQEDYSPDGTQNRTVVSLDNSDTNRLGDIGRFIEPDKSNLVVIDHHDGIPSDYHTYFLNADIGSTAEIVYELIQYVGLELTPAVARALYAGIVQDTGHFRFKKTRPETHRIAAHLLEYGVDSAVMAEALDSGFPVGRLYARQRLYEGLQLSANERIAWFVISQQDMRELNIDWDDLDGVVNELIEPDTVQIGLLFTIRETGKTRVSLRSRGPVDLLPAVRPYGGGGHKNACGVTIPLDIDRAVREFLPIVEKCLVETSAFDSNAV